MAVDDGGGASRSTAPAYGSSSATDISLKEFFNEKIWADRKLNNERFAFAAVIGATIWFFIERHLGDLNHDNARVAKVSENSVSQDTYSANEAQRKAELDKRDEWQGRVDAALGRGVVREEYQTEAKTDRRGSWGTGMQIAATGAAVLVALLLVFTTYRALKPATTSPGGGITTVFVQSVPVPSPTTISP